MPRNQKGSTPRKGSVQVFSRPRSTMQQSKMWENNNSMELLGYSFIQRFTLQMTLQTPSDPKTSATRQARRCHERSSCKSCTPCYQPQISNTTVAIGQPRNLLKLQLPFQESQRQSRGCLQRFPSDKMVPLIFKASRCQTASLCDTTSRDGNCPAARADREPVKIPTHRFLKVASHVPTLRTFSGSECSLRKAAQTSVQ